MAATAGLSAIALTPLAEVWFHTVSGLSPALTRFALLPVGILAVFPALSVALHLQRAVLVHAHRTHPATRATALEIITVAATLAATIHGFDVAGAVAASTAILAGRIVGVVWPRGALLARAARRAGWLPAGRGRFRAGPPGRVVGAASGKVIG